jgi:hypothetical protein
VDTERTTAGRNIAKDRVKSRHFCDKRREFVNHDDDAGKPKFQTELSTVRNAMGSEQSFSTPEFNLQPSHHANDRLGFKISE